jgi:hypothetical protein
MRVGYQIKHARLNRKQARQKYNAIYILSMKYCLPATAFTCKTIESIQGYTIDKFLSAIGYDRSTHRALVFGPLVYGGFGIRHLYTEMEGTKLESIISHIRAGLSLGAS